MNKNVVLDVFAVVRACALAIACVGLLLLIVYIMIALAGSPFGQIVLAGSLGAGLLVFGVLAACVASLSRMSIARSKLVSTQP